jgi:hypothetical protein
MRLVDCGLAMGTVFQQILLSMIQDIIIMRVVKFLTVWKKPFYINQRAPMAVKLSVMIRQWLTRQLGLLLCTHSNLTSNQEEQEMKYIILLAAMGRVEQFLMQRLQFQLRLPKPFGRNKLAMVIPMSQ